MSDAEPLDLEGIARRFEAFQSSHEANFDATISTRQPRSEKSAQNISLSLSFEKARREKGESAYVDSGLEIDESRAAFQAEHGASPRRRKILPRRGVAKLRARVLRQSWRRARARRLFSGGARAALGGRHDGDRGAHRARTAAGGVGRRLARGPGDGRRGFLHHEKKDAGVCGHKERKREREREREPLECSRRLRRPRRSLLPSSSRWA